MSAAAARAGPARLASRVRRSRCRRRARWRSSPSAASRALQWMQMLEPAASAARRLRGARRRRRDLRPAGRRAAARPGAHRRAAVVVALAAFALALLGRRRRRRAAAARPLGRARRRRSAAASPRCPARACPTAASTSGRALVHRPRRHRARGRSPRSSRSGRAARELGLRHVALVLLVTLYAVPAVALDLASRVPVAARCWRCSCVAYLRLERLQITDAGAAGAARRRRRRSSGSPRRPRSTPTSRGSTTRRGRCPTPPRSRPSFSWDHSYGPLDWPRDGRELLRVKAKRPAYWKATNLDDFDGRALGARPQLDQPRRLRRLGLPDRRAPSSACSGSASRCATCARRRS